MEKTNGGDSEEAFIIPDFGPCGDGNSDEETTESSNQKNCGCKNQKSCEEEVKEVKKVMTDKICYKCKEAHAQFRNKMDVVCAACLQFMLIHRFKNALRTHVRIQKDFPNCVAISGGSNSMAMLHYLYNCLAGNQSMKRMFLKVHVLYIDESQAVYNNTPEQAEANRNIIQTACEKYSIPYTILPIEALFDIDKSTVNLEQNVDSELMENEIFQKIHVDLPINKTIDVNNLEEKQARLKALLDCIGPASFRSDMVFFLKRWLMSDFCLRFNFKRIFIGSTAHKTATNLLAQLAKGRGASLCNDIVSNPTDSKVFGGREVIFCGPMREFLQKEIGIFNYLNKVDIIKQRTLPYLHPALKQPAPHFGSSDLLIDGFFSGLQDKYNVNTVPTVVRLTSKLKKIDMKNEVVCPLCLGIRDPINNLLEVGSTVQHIKHLEGGKVDIKAIKSENEWFTTNIEKVLCFGCKRLLIEVRNDKKGGEEKVQKMLDLLPDVIKENAERAFLVESSQKQKL